MSTTRSLRSGESLGSGGSGSRAGSMAGSKFSRMTGGTTSDEIVNNLNRTAIKKIMYKMQKDPDMGHAQVAVTATWKEGVVTGAGDKLVSYAPPELQLEAIKKGPTLYSFCPLISGACFSLIMMMDAAQRRYHFEAMGTHMRTNADFSGFYNDSVTRNDFEWHPWRDGVQLDILIRGQQEQEKLEKLARHADRHCPSSEIMKREFPVEVARFEKSKDGKEAEINWDEVPIYYDMDKYNEIEKKDKYIVNQFAQMTWHCQNENEQNPDSLMTFSFPNDAESNIVLSHDVPISSGKYANPVQGCFFGGLSSFMHTVAVRLYANGYKVDEIQGKISAAINKRKIMGVEKDGFVFPVGASIEINVVCNAPETELNRILYEVENMSPTMMNWRNELPLAFDVIREDPLLPPEMDIPMEIATPSQKKFAPFAFLRRTFGAKKPVRRIRRNRASEPI